MLFDNDNMFLKKTVSSDEFGKVFVRPVKNDQAAMRLVKSLKYYQNYFHFTSTLS